MKTPVFDVRPLCFAQASLFLLAAMAAISATDSKAATFIKEDNTTSLNLAASYTANSGVPGALDTIQVSTLGASRTANLGASMAVHAITYSATNQFQIGNTASAVLTIGSGGVTKTAGAALIFANAVSLGANQTWSSTVGTGNLQMNGVFSDGGFTLAVTGAGTFDLRGSNTFGANVTIDAPISVNATGGTVVFGGSNTTDSFSIPNGRAQGATIGNFGVASNFGDGGTNTTITVGGSASNGVFDYTGTTVSTNRTITRDRRSTGSGIDVSTAGQTLTISGNLVTGTTGTAIGATNWQMGGAGNLTVTGVISNSSASDVAGIDKNGSGTLTLGGNNTFTGAVTINAGTVAISASERIGNSNVLVLAGGTFSVGTFTETLGTLDLTAAGGTLNIGSGGKFLFADSSALDWNGGLLSISGTFASGSSIKFGSAAGTLTGSQLASISIAGFNNVALDSSGFLTASAIPEPSAYAALAGAGMLGLATMRRRRPGV